MMAHNNINIGDLVRFIEPTPDGPMKGSPGFVVGVDKEWYGARQAFKVLKPERGHCIAGSQSYHLAPTKDGIQDRITVLWPDVGDISYEVSSILEVISQ